MHAVVPLLALAALGIDVGWEPAPAGGWDYIIQVEPEALDALARGVEIASDLPPEIRDVRSLRLRVGDHPVQRTAAKPLANVDQEDGPRLVTAVEVEPSRTKPRSSARSATTTTKNDSTLRDREPADSATTWPDRNGSLTTDPPTMGPSMPSSTWQSTRGADRRWNADLDDARNRAAPTDPSNRSATRAADDVRNVRSTVAADPPTTVEFGPVDEELEPRSRAAQTAPTGPRLPPSYAPPAERLDEPALPRTDYAALPRDSWRDELRAEEDTGQRPRLESTIEGRRYADDLARVASRTGGTISRPLDDAPISGDLNAANPYAYPLTVALVGLFLSMGGNLFLGWMTLDLRNRCRRLLVRLATAAPLRSSAFGNGELEF